MAAKVNGNDMKAGRKRVNLTIGLPDFDDLYVVAEYNHLPVATLSESWVVQRAREECKKIRKNGYVPVAERGGDLFTKKKKGKK